LNGLLGNTFTVIKFCVFIVLATDGLQELSFIKQDLAKDEIICVGLDIGISGIIVGTCTLNVLFLANTYGISTIIPFSLSLICHFETLFGVTDIKNPSSILLYFNKYYIKVRFEIYFYL
jgi:hypothetical protein